MERDMNQPVADTLCRGGCGFYGSPATDGLCSQCFKDTLKRKQDPASRLSPTSSGTASNMFASSSRSAEKSVAPSSPSSDSRGPTADESGSRGAAVPSTSSSGAATADGKGAASGEGTKEKAECSAPTPPAEPGSPSSSPAAASDPPPAKKKNRCHQCNKRVGLTGAWWFCVDVVRPFCVFPGFECRCGGVYCGTHRYSDMHSCSFDYKKLGQMEIAKNNPVIVSEKIQKL